MLIEKLASIRKEKPEGNACTTHIEIDPKHPLFTGHFPGSPITPGVIMIQFFKEQAERFTGKNLQIATASNIKFLEVVNPQENREIRLESFFKNENESIVLDGKVFHQRKLCLKLRLGFEVVDLGL